MPREVDPKRTRKAKRIVRKLAAMEAPDPETGEIKAAESYSDWERTFLGEVEGRLDKYGSAFHNLSKGRAEEAKWTEHKVVETAYDLDVVEDGEVKRQSVPMRNAMNEVLRDWYVDDCRSGVVRWNKTLEKHGLSDRLRLPDRKFNRGIGQFSSIHTDPDGRLLSDEEWNRRKYEWLPSPEDKAYLHSIQVTPVYKPGQFANYIAPPARGINRMPIDFEYVRTEG